MKSDSVSSDRRSELQREADAMDCDLYRVICRAEALAERIKVAGPHLRNYANALSKARHHVRCLMHTDDREKTRGY